LIRGVIVTEVKTSVNEHETCITDEKRVHQRGGLVKMTASFNLLPFHPAVAVPIPAALMLAKRNARRGLPIIRGE